MSLKLVRKFSHYRSQRNSFTAHCVYRWWSWSWRTAAGSKQSIERLQTKRITIYTVPFCSCTCEWQLPWDVQADADFLCDKAAVLRDMRKGTLFIWT